MIQPLAQCPALSYPSIALFLLLLIAIIILIIIIRVHAASVSRHGLQAKFVSAQLLRPTLLLRKAASGYATREMINKRSLN